MWLLQSNNFTNEIIITSQQIKDYSKDKGYEKWALLTPGNTTAPIPLFNFDLPLPPRPDNPAPRGLRFPGNPDPRPYVTDKEKSAFCKSPKKF